MTHRLSGSRRTVYMTSSLRRAGVAVFSVGRGASGFAVLRKTWLASAFGSPLPDIDAVLASVYDPATPETMAEAVRLSLKPYFDANAGVETAIVNTRSFKIS